MLRGAYYFMYMQMCFLACKLIYRGGHRNIWRRGRMIQIFAWKGEVSRKGDYFRKARMASIKLFQELLSKQINNSFVFPQCKSDNKMFKHCRKNKPSIAYILISLMILLIGTSYLCIYFTHNIYVSC